MAKIDMDVRQNVIFRVTCSKGTYVRSLCADFGKTLSSCAHLTALQRDSIGTWFALAGGFSSNSDLINFDTTTLIAIGSGISNGNTEKLMAVLENELRSRFKSNFEFVIAQILDWLKHNPTDIESYIRPDCIILSIYLIMENFKWEEVHEGRRFHSRST